MALRKSNPRRFRARPDLLFSSPDGRRHTVKDPVSLSYFMLRPREHFLLRELQTPKTLEQLRASYLRHFPQEQLSHDELLGFCSAMHENSLICSDGAASPFRGPRGVAQQRTKRLGWLSSPLAVRLPGIDPSPLLSGLAWLGRLTFNWWFFCLACLAAAIALVLVAQQPHRLAEELSRLDQLRHPEHLMAALLAFAALKSWHELGHGLACQRFGGECHEIGVMLLALTPCLYCDVSDTWAFPERWRRAAVAAAGVYFELLLAIAALGMWAVLSPGFLSHLALCLAVFASISTLLVNANPLLRFDGYYVLADAWGVANLHQQSRSALFGPLSRWVQGGGAAPEYDAPRSWLALYAAASCCYLAAVLIVILWAIHHVCTVNGFRFIGDSLVALAATGLAVKLISSLLTLARGPRFGAWWLPTLRLAFVVVVLTAALGGALLLDTEQSLKAACRLESSESYHVSAPSAGELVTLVSYGQSVRPGDTLARVADVDLQLSWLKTREETLSLQTQLRELTKRAQRNPKLFADMKRLRSRLAEVRKESQAIASQARAMRLTSPIAGVVLRPPHRPEPAEQDAPAWVGAAMDHANQGCGVEPGDPLCIVAGGRLQAVLLLSEADSGLARLGDRVRLVLDRAPEEEFYGRVEEISLASAQDARTRPIASTDLAQEADLRDPLDLTAAYRVLVRLESWPVCAQHGSLGQARIVTGREDLASRLARHARQTFHFQRRPLDW